jgi:DNA-binding MurR/RpiR family transcriptional regulator
MSRDETFTERATAGVGRLSAAEQRVTRFFRENREEVLVASASALAAKVGTSDATVIRAAKALGYSGLDDLRRGVAAELRRSLSPAARLARTLDALRNDDTAFGLTIDIHLRALEGLRRDIGARLFETAIDRLAQARRVVVFGIGPSSALADYFAIQLGRFGIEAASLAQTGLLLADGLLRLGSGDVVVILAYGRIYRELEVLLRHAGRVGLARILLTDTLGVVLRPRPRTSESDLVEFC